MPLGRDKSFINQDFDLMFDIKIKTPASPRRFLAYFSPRPCGVISPPVKPFNIVKPNRDINYSAAPPIFYRTKMPARYFMFHRFDKITPPRLHTLSLVKEDMEIDKHWTW